MYHTSNSKYNKVCVIQGPQGVDGRLKESLCGGRRTNNAFRLDNFDEKWNGQYPKIAVSWRSNWANPSTYFKYPQEVKTLIYTTNAIEGFNRQLRKITKNKGVFPCVDIIHVNHKKYKKKENQNSMWYNVFSGKNITQKGILIFYE